VHPHPDPHGVAARELVLAEPPLGLAAGHHGVGRVGERDEQPVPLGLDLHAAVLGERGAQQLVVVVEHLVVRRVAETCQQRGRTLDVGEDEGHAPGGEADRGGVRHAPESSFPRPASPERTIFYSSLFTAIGTKGLRGA